MHTLIKFGKESKNELDKVIFPTKKNIKHVFLNVFIMTTIITLFLSLVDFIIKLGLSKIL